MDIIAFYITLMFKILLVYSRLLWVTGAVKYHVWEWKSLNEEMIMILSFMIYVGIYPGYDNDI